MAETDLRGQVAIVTGASRGLGRHVAKELAARGVRVAVCARTAPELDRLAKEIRDSGGDAMSIGIDVSNWKYVERGVAVIRNHFGPVDILVNNAGVGWHKPFEEWTVEEIDLAIDVNLKGTIYMSRAVLDDMRRSGRGQIVNVASDVARRFVPGMAPYVASKFGVLGFAGSLLREVKKDGVRIVTLTPGIIDTCFNGGVEGSRDEAWSLRPAFVAKTIADLLTLPPGCVVDEISIHAMGQEF